MAKKSTKTQAKNRAWKMFSKYIRTRDTKNEYGRCVTCKKVFHFNQLQAGHFVPGRVNGILFDERGVHAQCVGCNVWGRGKMPVYEKFMREKYGQKVINELWENARKTVQYKKHDYDEIYEKYKKKLEEL